MSYGLGCYNERNCKAEVVGPTQEAVDQAAYDAGWKLGHSDGQSYYSCPECASGLFDPRPMYPLNWDGKPPASNGSSQGGVK